MNALKIIAGLTEPVRAPMKHLTGSNGDLVLDVLLIMGGVLLAGLILKWRVSR
jgi:hypothetical protein